MQRAILFALALSTAVSAQTFTLSTGFNSGMTLGSGSISYFDLHVFNDVTITSLDVHLANGNSGANVHVWVTPNTWVGKQDNAGAWSQAVTGGIIPNPLPPGNWSSVVLPSSIPLTAGNYGIAVQFNGDGQRFGDGLFPLYRSLVDDANLEMFEGGVGQTAFNGLNGAPRVFNTRIYYELGAPMATFETYGTGCDGLSTQAITLDAANGDRPVVGTMFDMEIGSLPPTVGGGSLLIYTGQQLPGLPLDAINMAGCELLVGGTFLGSLPIAPAVPTATVSLDLTFAAPLAGVHLYVQGAMLGIPSTGLGVGVTNGGDLLIDVF